MPRVSSTPCHVQRDRAMTTPRRYQSGVNPYCRTWIWDLTGLLWIFQNAIQCTVPKEITFSRAMWTTVVCLQIGTPKMQQDSVALNNCRLLETDTERYPSSQQGNVLGRTRSGTCNSLCNHVSFFAAYRTESNDQPLVVSAVFDVKNF